MLFRKTVRNRLSDCSRRADNKYFHDIHLQFADLRLLCSAREDTFF
jgi:hypothetical protein